MKSFTARRAAARRCCILFRSDVSTPTELPTDGAGLYALQTDDRTVVCIDSFGQTVGTAKAAFKVSNIAFEDGVLVLQGENQQAKYLPTGEITP